MKSMKKRSIALVVNAIIAMVMVVSAHAEECTQFSCVDSNWGTVYTTDVYGSNGGFVFKSGNIAINALPYGMKNQGQIYSFCCYNGRIYYMTGEEGSSPEYPAKIYSCDMNGQDNRLLADNVEGWSKAFIVDNVLYYQGFYSWSDRVRGYYGGIYKINLVNLSWKKIVSGNAQLDYCDGEYAYFSTWSPEKYAAVDVNGKKVWQ